ncbi:hypothetical protein K469DRAFT_716292 [Zopfia rhizophila CBS 207.26]|uniref:Uncharacterized protein n=1 Tax=Zopfia rhizophila CBS 207.26 TaxID=1314779 RepID=A0A6A6DM98_9PEZI|nr:hypothetical protein K469DRAFT_716292 [Zopfia rhizophila CBS 207.26]
MGIPYSREINAAFEQVTPLVAAGFKVLQTTKNISILLAAIQVLTVLLLALILVVLVGVLYSINPDLETERKEIVTPVLLRLARSSPISTFKKGFSVFIGLFVLYSVCYFVWASTKEDVEETGNDDADKALEEEASKSKKKGKAGKKTSEE